MKRKGQTMKKMTVAALGGVLVWATVPAAYASTILFNDQFNEAISAPLDAHGTNTSITNYWKTIDTGANGLYSLTESGGSMTMVATDNTATSFQAGKWLYSGALQSYNFMTAPVTFAASGLALTANAPNGNLYFDVTSKSLAPGSTNDTATARIGFRLRNDGFFRLKYGNSNTWFSGDMSGSAITLSQHGPGSASLLNNSSTATITGFEMTLDASSWVANNATGGLAYNVRVSYTGTNANDTNTDGWISSADATFSDLSGTLTSTATTSFVTAWLSDNGGTTTSTALASMSIHDRTTSIPAVGNYSQLVVGDVTVSVIPEPASLGMLAVSGLLMLPRRKK